MPLDVLTDLLGRMLLHFLWQGLAVAVVAAVVVRVFGFRHGNARYGAYLAAFVVMIVCPLATFVVLGGEAESPVVPVVAQDVTVVPEPVGAVPYSVPSLPLVVPEIDHATTGAAEPTVADEVISEPSVSLTTKPSWPFATMRPALAWPRL